MCRIARSMALGVVVLLCFIFAGTGQPWMPDLPGSQEGTSTGESINFGDVAVGETATAQYVFKVLESSETAVRVTIYDPCAPFGLTDLASRSMTLQPGQSITFRVTFSPPAVQSYTCNFEIRAEGGYPVQVSETVVQLAGRGVSSAGAEGASPDTGTSGLGFPFPVPLIEPLVTGAAEAGSGMTDEEGRFDVTLSPTTSVSGTLTESEAGPLANQSFNLAETADGYEIVVPGFPLVTVPVSSTMTFLGLSSVDLGVISLMRADNKPPPCDCSSLPSNEDCKRRSIQYYIEIPDGCEPSWMSLTDSTNAAALWDKIVFSEEEFESWSEANRRNALANQSIIGIESNLMYEYQGRGGASNTKITIARREGDPKKWLFEISSCCHTIPTLQIGLSCPGTQMSKDINLGLTFDENNQYVVEGRVLVDFKALTRENYNSFFEDCSVPYCDVNERRDPDALASNGRFLLMIAPDSSCKFDLAAFEQDLYETLKANGCNYSSREMDTRDGSLLANIYTNRCTPQVVACIEEVLKRHTDCKEVHWIGRQINIRPTT